MQDKYARLITTINSARNQLYKLAGEAEDAAERENARKGQNYEDMAALGLNPGTGEGAGNTPTPQTTAAGGVPSTYTAPEKQSLLDKLRGGYDKGLAYLKDNPEQAIATGAGALGVGAGAYLLAKLLKKKRAWMYGLGGALAGGAAGALGGQAAYAGGKKAYAAIKQWLDEKRKLRNANAAGNADLKNFNDAGKEGVGLPTTAYKENNMNG